MTIGLAFPGAATPSGGDLGTFEPAATASDTNVLTGSDTDYHTFLKNSDGSNELQHIRFGSRGYASVGTKVLAFDIYNSAAANELNIGRRLSGAQGITLGRLAAVSSKTSGTNVNVLEWTSSKFQVLTSFLVTPSTSDPTVDDQWIYRTDTNQLCIRSGGTVRKVTLT